VDLVSFVTCQTTQTISSFVHEVGWPIY